MFIEITKLEKTIIVPSENRSAVVGDRFRESVYWRDLKRRGFVEYKIISEDGIEIVAETKQNTQEKKYIRMQDIKNERNSNTTSTS